jgi:hypothetical protein
MLNASKVGSLAKKQNRRPILPRRVQRLRELATWNKAELNMTTPSKIRILAHSLLAYELIASKSSEPMESATLRVYEKLRQSLSGIVGVAAFESLAFRALTQAKSEAPSLWPVQIAGDGSLQGLGELKPQIDMDKDLADKFPGGDGGIVLIARLLGLLLMFLGEAITLRLLRNAWPGEAFDDRNSEHGRKA